MEIKDEIVYLTFKTDRETSYHLKNIAHLIGKSQPELINEICQSFVKTILEDAKKEQSIT